MYFTPAFNTVITFWSEKKPNHYYVVRCYALTRSHLRKRFHFGCGQTLSSTLNFAGEKERSPWPALSFWTLPCSQGPLLRICQRRHLCERSLPRHSAKGPGRREEIKRPVFVHRGHFNWIAEGAIRQAALLTGSKKPGVSGGRHLTASTAACKQMFVCPVWGRRRVTLPDCNINWTWNCVNGKRRNACCYGLSDINHLLVFTQVFVSRTFTDLSFFLQNTFD